MQSWIYSLMEDYLFRLLTVNEARSVDFTKCTEGCMSPYLSYCVLFLTTFINMLGNVYIV
jgi:hypothetical protein